MLHDRRVSRSGSKSNKIRNEMDDLKILIEALAKMPTLAIWVVAMYFAFKIAVIGSVYGVIRYVAMQVHDWAVKKKEPDVKIQQHNIVLEGKLITSLREDPEELHRLFRRLPARDLDYIFNTDIKMVHKALDEYFTRNPKIGKDHRFIFPEESEDVAN